MKFRDIILVLLIILVLIFVLQNTQIVEVKVLFWKLSMSRVILIVLALAVGFTLGRLSRISLFLGSKKNRENQSGPGN